MLHRLRIAFAALIFAFAGAATVKSASAYSAIEYALMAFYVIEQQIPILNAFGD